jgi:O-antigen ligase
MVNIILFKTKLLMERKIVINKTAIHSILTAVFLLTFGPFNSVFSVFSLSWNITIFTACALVCAALYLRNRKIIKDENTSALFYLCIIYTATVLINSLFHGAALRLAPDALNVNIIRTKAIIWKVEYVRFTLFYLFFPVLFLLQYLILKKIGSRLLIRSFAIAITVSLMVLLYQYYVDLSLFNTQYWEELQRVGGLSIDPNAFAMTAYLLVPLFLSGILLETKKVIKFFFIILIGLLLLGILLSGNRTVLAGMLLFALLSPVILALANKRLSKSAQLTLFTLPIVLIAVLYILLPAVISHSASIDLGVTIDRLANTWDGFIEGGVSSVFLQDEVRSRNFRIAWILIQKAPLAGWGPGGFYREFPNIQYQLGEGPLLNDSALNHYLMIAADLGMVSLFMNLAIIIAPLIIGFITIKKLSDVSQRFIVLTLIVVDVIFLVMINTVPPSYFPGLIWVWTSQLVYFVILGEENGILLRIRLNKRRKVFFMLCAAVILVTGLGSYQTSFGLKGYSARQKADWWRLKYDKNCYPGEEWEVGRVSWCQKEAFLSVPIRKGQTIPENIRLKISVHHPDIQIHPVTVRYGGKYGPVHKAVIMDNSWKSLEIEVTEDYIYDFISSYKRREIYIVLSFDVSRTWIPKEWGLGDDTRELGVAVLMEGLVKQVNGLKLP